MRKGNVESGDREFRVVNPHAAGIDIGAEFHMVAVPEGRDPEGRRVRDFSAFTGGLRELSAWLKRCGVRTVAMESTGVFWIPLFELLEREGLEVCLVNARHVKNVRGRKSDVLDCQWIQQLHSFGLLRAAFRPAEEVAVLRSYLRQRAMLVTYAAEHTQHMQKALTEMNLKLQHAVSDVTGQTGLRIIRAIVAGERDPQRLAQNRDRRCHSSEATIAASLTGSYREEHLFALRQALELYDFYQGQIAQCDQQIEAHWSKLEDRSGGTPVPPDPKPHHKSPRGNAPAWDLRSALYRFAGVDLTAVPGLDVLTVAKVLAETGTDMSPWPTVHHFTSWLNLCPGTRSSGGRCLKGRRPKIANRAAQALRVAARSLCHSKSSLGALYRAMRSRCGPAQANVATAHKLARIIYAMLNTGQPYREQGQDGYAQRNRDRILRNLRRTAKVFGLELVPLSPAPS